MCCIEREIIYTVKEEEEEPLAYFILDGRFFLFFGTNHKVFNFFESQKKKFPKMNFNLDITYILKRLILDVISYPDANYYVIENDL